MDQAAYGSTSGPTIYEAARLTAFTKHISTLEDVFGSVVESIKEDIENDALGSVLVAQGEARLNDLCMMHGCVEGVLQIITSAFVSKIPKESSHSVGYGQN